MHHIPPSTLATIVTSTSFEASAGLVHIVLWVSVALTLVSAAVNIHRAAARWDYPAAPLFLVRGILSLGYTLVYASRLTQPVRQISDPTSLFAFVMGLVSWLLVWIIPAAIIQPPPVPSQLVDVPPVPSQPVDGPPKG